MCYEGGVILLALTRTTRIISNEYISGGFTMSKKLDTIWVLTLSLNSDSILLLY